MSSQGLIENNCTRKTLIRITINFSVTGPSTVGSRYLKPLRKIKKGGSYWEFELSGVENKGPKKNERKKNGVHHISTYRVYSLIKCNYRSNMKQNSNVKQSNRRLEVSKGRTSGYCHRVHGLNATSSFNVSPGLQC